MLQLKNQRSVSKTVRGFSITSILKGIRTFQSQRVHAFCWIKIETLTNTKRNPKWKIPHKVLEWQTLCFSSYKNRKLKLKLWWVGAHERKKGHFLYRLFCPKEFFFNICVLSQSIVYWLHFHNIHTFTYEKILLFILFCSFFKLSKAFSLPLKAKNRFCIKSHS